MIKKKIILVIISFITSYVILDIYAVFFIKKKIDPGLGENNFEYFAKFNEYPIHCQDLTNIDYCLDSVSEFNDKKNILWLGNSQLHTINEKKNKDKTSSFYLFEKFFNKGYFTLTLSQPNANLQEHLLIYDYVSSFNEIELLILPLVFDDFRETGIRENLIELLNNKNINTNLKKSSIGIKLLENNIKKNISTKDSTPQEFSEEYLNKKLSNISSVWDNRDFYRSSIIINLRNMRNFIFRIDPSSIRKVIPQRYEDNFLALKEITKLSKKNRTKIILYIAPIRNDVPLPYDLKEYDNFKSQMYSFSKVNNIPIYNFENVIPNEEWGYNINGESKELDFMHFKAMGHKILAKELHNKINISLSN